MKARARRDDPSTSHEAASLIERTSAKTQRDAILAFVLANPGTTCDEIAAGVGLDRVATGKRLPELRDAGLIGQGPIRKCGIKGRRMLTWGLPPRPGQTSLFGNNSLHNRI
jgi:hypothetical protein